MPRRLGRIEATKNTICEGIERRPAHKLLLALKIRTSAGLASGHGSADLEEDTESRHEADFNTSHYNS